MGLPMAENLMAAGFDLTCFDVDKSAVEHVASKGAKGASTAAEASAGMDAVITMVPSDAVLRGGHMPSGAWNPAYNGCGCHPCELLDSAPGHFS